MNHHQLLKSIVAVSSFAIAILGSAAVAIPHAQAAELSLFIDTAFAKEATTSDILTADERIVILKTIISSSQDEISNLKDKLADLQLDNQWARTKDNFLNQLATSSNYYDSLSNQLDAKDITIDEIKSTAKDLKDWRETTYTPQLKEISNLILLSQSDVVYHIVQNRHNKISGDLKRLDKQKLVNTDILKKYLSQAEKSIKNAKDLNDQAKDLYYIVSVEPLQPKKDAEQADQTETISTTKESIFTDQPKQDPQDIVNDLSKASLKELKTAYELFFKMNDWIRK